MSKSRKHRHKRKYYIYYAIRDGDMIEIVTPFLFDYSVDKEEAKTTCMWWLNKEFPNDDFKHLAEPGRDFDSRIIGWTLKIENNFSLEGTDVQGIRRVEPITHFEGMCKV